MENHPIPQDVTGFQFKLIGNMTLKQFLYLASGCIIAWIFYALPIFFLIKFPLVLLFAGLGFAFAFLPVEGRPMDTMLSLFFKALFAADEYIYIKSGKILDISLPTQKKQTKVKTTEVKISREEINILLKTIEKKPQKPKNTLDEKEEFFIKNLLASKPQIIAQHAVDTPIVPVQQPEKPTIESLKGPKKPIEFSHENPEDLEKELEKEEKELEHELTETTLSPQKYAELQKQLEDILAEKKQLEEELANLRAKFEAKKGIRKPPVPLGGGAPISAFAPEAPNLISGVIKDPKGNILPSILVDIQDASGSPVRAFKTNVIGQFASATALPNGTYKITFEDASGTHTFSPVELTANGTVIPPLEITAIDQRDELRKQLFGSK